MKNMFLVMLLIVAVSSFGQTKQETVDWLNSKSKHQFVYGDILKSSQKMKFNADGTFEIISTDYDLPFNPTNPKATCVTILKGNFKDFSPNSVSVKSINGFLFISMNTTGATNRIQVKNSQNENCPTYSTTGLLFGAFDNNEQNISGRLKKAFSHMINLCGGKNETF